MVNELKEIYGSYSIPKEVYRLIQLEIDLQKEGLSLATIGLIPIDDYFYYYSITPPDLIPFASTGGNGIHFGFLTDFHEVLELKDAPIVCVSPTNDPPVRYVAKNFEEFMNLVVSVPYVEMLEQFCTVQDKDEMNEIIRENASDLSNVLQIERTLIFKRLQQTFNAKSVDVLDYLEQAKMERKKKVSIATLDGLGIIGSNSGRSFSFAKDRNVGEKEIERMQSFLYSANKEEKLAFVRDANYWYILTPDYDEAVMQLIVSLLQSLVLKDEAYRVLSKN
ncbi:hypothetical protein [Psychrobacillus sp. NPDC093180]|uniref:hypothetical protein n=1 Tax=Psychrobacillus sp. NPDC093180 TaxID=3364489 RepID=UPI0038200A2D